jgi:hypothetical protein
VLKHYLLLPKSWSLEQSTRGISAAFIWQSDNANRKDGTLTCLPVCGREWLVGKAVRDFGAPSDERSLPAVQPFSGNQNSQEPVLRPPKWRNIAYREWMKKSALCGSRGIIESGAGKVGKTSTSCPSPNPSESLKSLQEVRVQHCLRWLESINHRDEDNVAQILP